MRLTHYDERDKRWQINNDYGAVTIDELNYAVGEAVNKLAAYEDAEEQGRLVEVVRCRECYFRGLDGAALPVCTGAMTYCHTPDDWFCAAGKSKDGGQDE